jgi:WD40 repeat protein
LSGSRDGSVKQWDLESEQCVQTLTANILSPVNCLALTHDRTKLFCGHSDGSVVMWALGIKKSIQVSTFQDFDTCVTCVLVTHDDSAVISVSASNLIRRDLYEPHRDAVHFHGVHLIRSVVLSADSTLVFCCCFELLVIWNAITGQLLSEVEQTRFSAISAPCIARAGVFNFIACRSSKKTYRDDGYELLLLEYNSEEHSVIEIQRGNRGERYEGNYEDDKDYCDIRFQYECRYSDDEYQHRKYDNDTHPYSVCLSNDGKRVICGHENGTVFVGRFLEKEVLCSMGNFAGQQFQPMLLREPRRERIYRREACFREEDSFGVAISGDGAFCASSSPGNTVAVWDLNKMLKFAESSEGCNYPPRVKFEGHTDHVLAVLFF